ncbi:uncharacterized protein LOC108026097 [Drosophila biarmipes]|uniref:uncharacterized protein LOC108026097 n=1 Tax=Drosophila biarmipes TaxID=125945 RepID=UPI0007E6383F|nr:uncharacterized protein LOC108026097 [Drosophila biarmipes]
MQSKWMAGWMIVVISIAGALGQPERYDRLPSWGWSHSQIGGGQDPAHYQASRENREDLCGHCFCTHLKAICDFKLNKTLSSEFNDKLMVPLNIKYIEVRLTAGTQFVMFENFFLDNQVNYFGLIGVRKDDQVEITSNAFSHNKGGYPSIEIGNISRVFLRDKFLTGAEYKLLVEDVDQLTVFPNALQMTNLDCSFKRIHQLDLMKNAFNPGNPKYGINLRVEDSSINQLGIFGVSMGKVSLLRCTIATIMSNAFDVTSIKELIIEGCNIATIETQALTNKLHSDKVAILDTVIGTIEGQAISQSGITTMIMFGNKISRIRSNAIQIAAVSLFIRNNSMSHVEPNWLSVSQADHVEIENNRFHDYGRCELNIGSSNCSFRNNVLQNPQPGSLNFTCRVHQVRVGHECSCNKAWLSELTDHDLESEVMCRVVEQHTGCLNATSTNVRRFVNEACGGNVTRYCSSDGQWTTKAASDQLGNYNRLPITWLACIIFVATLSIVILVMMVAKCRRTGGGAAGNGKDICQIQENIREQLRQCAMELRGDDMIRKSILKIINGRYNKDECNKRIFYVIDSMPKNSSVIERLLLEHIKLSHCDVNPSLDGAYATSACAAANAGPPPSAPSPQPSDDEEPIYQEPDQHPLMCSDYSAPLHPAEDTYAEPFNATNANDMPPAYQYATPMRILTPPQQQQQQPSTMASYATPVWRSTPSATPTSRPPSGATTAPRAVKDLRQALQNSPQFHPNQLTSARNQRQILQTLPVQPPPYSQTQRSQVRGQRRRSFECLDGAASLAAMEHMDSGSDHSGGSDVTVQMADVIDYADA